MTTALNIVERALLDLRVLPAGDSASAQEASDGLVYLNDLIQSLSNEGLMINSVVTDTVTMTGAASYTYGTGGNINASIPESVKSCFFTLSGYDYPVDIITLDQWNAIADKTTTGGVVDRVYINFTYPLAAVHVYPQPSSGTLNLSTTKPLTELATSATVLSMPTGYERMLRLWLAVEMMPQYGVMNQAILEMAQKAKLDIKRVNAANNPVVTALGLPVGFYPRANIFSGY